MWDPVAITAVLDHPNPANPITFTTVIPNSGDPSRSCPGVPDEQVYDAKTNPDGVRCTLQDYMVNVFGRATRTGSPTGRFDNVGIQYGLKGLRQGLISPPQFVDLNANIGGARLRRQPDRRADRGRPGRAASALYRTGAVNSANNLDKVAIIDLRGPDPGAFHDVYRTYAMRARLLRNFGTAANQVLWRGQVPLIGDPAFADQAILALDRVARRGSTPTAATSASPGRSSRTAPTVGHRAVHRRSSATTVPQAVCDQTVAAYGTPRMAAGGPLADDTMQCQLKPLARADYDVTFTDDQWARLRGPFPNGVCDYTRPGVAQRGAISWLTYQDAAGGVVYGGRPLGPPPVSTVIS